MRIVIHATSFATIVALILALAVGLVVAAPAGANQDGPAAELSISLDTTEVTTLTGERFTFTSTVTNNGTSETGPLVANLNFVSIDQETYMDPEDWSGHRSQTVEPITPGGSATQTWTVKPVLAGEIGVYVAVLPGDPELVSAGSLAISPGLHISVGEERSLNPGGVLPVVLAVPGFIAAAFVGLVAARRRL